MRNLNLISFLLLFYFSSCEEHNKENQIKCYFEKMEWRYPFHLKNENFLRFSNTFYEEEPVMYDTSQLTRLKEAFLNQALEYFKKELSIDTTVGYVIEKPIIYVDLPDSLVYSIGIKKFTFNKERARMPCQECEAIENNTVFVSGNRVIFKIKNDSILEFKNWME